MIGRRRPPADQAPTQDMSQDIPRLRRKANLTMVGALAAAIPALAGAIIQWFEVQTAKEKLEAQQTALVAEHEANEDGWKMLVGRVNKHGDDIERLRRCEIGLAVLEEWRRGVDREMRRQHGPSRRAPAAATLTLPETVIEEPLPNTRKAHKAKRAIRALETPK